VAAVSAAGRLLAVAAATLIGVAPGVAPCAAAPAGLLPPPVDPAALPPPATPRPAVPTAQRVTCTAHPVARHPGPGPLAGLDLPALWALSRGRGQQVAVIDTGVSRHRRLRDVRGGGDFVSTGDGTGDCDGHGTLVAGLIAAAPDPADPAGFAGVAPEATVLAIRQTSVKFGPAAERDTVGVGDVDSLARAVRTAADLGAGVINISTVACRVGSIDDRALGAALGYAVDVKDAVVVAAAGNTGGLGQCPAQLPTGAGLSWDTATVAVSPAWYDDYVLTVAAAAPDGTASAFSMPGPWVDVAAPGEGLVSLNPDGSGLLDQVETFGRLGPVSGTSYAAPVVAGLVALVRARFPELSARQVMARIEATATGPGWNPALGNGLIDPAAALRPDTAPPAPAPGTSAVPAPDPGPTRMPAGRVPAVTGSAVCAVLLAGCWALSRRGRPARRSG
jgi:membrane-anchored mycosin MYCP